MTFNICKLYNCYLAVNQATTSKTGLFLKNLNKCIKID